MSELSTTLGIIGAGNLASSLIRGLHQKSPEAWNILLTDIDTTKASHLASAYNIPALSLADLVRQSSIIILAVKPHNMPDLIGDLSGLLASSSPHPSHPTPSRSAPLLISVAAGLSLDFYETRLPAHPLIRTMPNTSALVSRSVTGLVRGSYVTDAQASQAEQIFRSLGQILWLDDDKINALTAVSGSGPAYFYYLAETMAEAGQHLGLTPEEASFLAAQTLIGAGRMLEGTSKREDNQEAPAESPAVLRAKVTSPNGTTHAALESMKQRGFAELVLHAMTACRNRAAEMEKELNP